MPVCGRHRSSRSLRSWRRRWGRCRLGRRRLDRRVKPTQGLGLGLLLGHLDRGLLLDRRGLLDLLLDLDQEPGVQATQVVQESTAVEEEPAVLDECGLLDRRHRFGRRPEFGLNAWSKITGPCNRCDWVFCNATRPHSFDRKVGLAHRPHGQALVLTSWTSSRAL